jgi:hypothetical protein
MSFAAMLSGRKCCDGFGAVVFREPPTSRELALAFLNQCLVPLRPDEEYGPGLGSKQQRGDARGKLLGKS